MSVVSTRQGPGDIRITTLENGMRVLTDPMPSVESVSLGVWVGVGARNEPAEHNGVSHMLEHMAFKGTTRRSAVQIAEEIENVGGHLNAYTSREQTAYYAKVLKDDTGLAIDVLSDILLNSTFEEDELERERTVILQEIGQAHDTPDDIIFDHYQQTAFPDQPIGRPVLGAADIVRSMDRETISNYIQQNYGGEAMIFAAAGAVEHDKIVAEIDAKFSGLGKKAAGTSSKAFYKGGEFREERDLEQVHLLLGFEGLPFHDEDFYALQVFSSIFGGGMSSRLFQEVREKRGLVYSIYSFASSYQDTGLFGIYAGTGAEQTAELIPVICDEMKKAVGTISDDELARARAQLKSGLLMSRESTSNRCEQMAQHTLVFGKPLSVDELVARVDGIDAKALGKIVERLLTSAPTLAAIGPLEKLESYDSLASRLS